MVREAHGTGGRARVAVPPWASAWGVASACRVVVARVPLPGPRDVTPRAQLHLSDVSCVTASRLRFIF
jgi:hypothetical protein